MIGFEGRVAIVTGAGRGMGRETALALARRGARVIVNDYGGGGDTMSPGGIDVAQAVVDEITSAGGTAIADGSSVGTGASADAIVGRAMDAFGRIDILVNNAGGMVGIVRLDEDTDEQVEGVLRSNLIGPYMLMRRVWPVMRAQRYGRIVNIMTGGIVGMFGTAAYTTGKSGLIGLTNVAAVEGEPEGILTNGVWPIGNTRLVGKLTNPAVIEWFKKFPPTLVAEGIVYLCSSENKVNGEMFNIGGGQVKRVALYGADGFHDPDLTAESLALGFEKARDMTSAAILTKIRSETEVVPEEEAK